MNTVGCGPVAPFGRMQPTRKLDAIARRPFKQSGLGKGRKLDTAVRGIGQPRDVIADSRDTIEVGGRRCSRAGHHQAAAVQCKMSC